MSSITDSFYPHEDDDDEWEDPNPPLLYGRTREILLLTEAYQKVLQTKKASTVLVHGVSGSGKTSLVDTLRQHICEDQGYFVAGKYFQDSGIQEPYSAIMAAFSDLCDLVIQSEDFTEERRREIQQKLGSDGHLLAMAITNLAPFLDQSEERDEMDTRNDAAFAQFKVACKIFLHAMSSDKHRIVLFIDDIQWMDEGSRRLIGLLLNDPELKNVMLILAYRDEEASSVADTLEKTMVDMLDIQLQNLQAGAVYQLICEILGSSSAKIKELSDVVALKTRGNPFHVIHAVDAIRREKLLIYDVDVASWVFDVDEIQRELMVSEDLADLLALKMRRLPSGVQETLKVASLLGFQFREDLLLDVTYAIRDRAIIKEEDYESLQCISVSLKSALDGGFIEKTKEGYQFSHDKIQAASRSMMDEAEEEELHMVIGDTFLSIGGAESIYQAALHLHHAPGFVYQKAERVKLALVNLEAAKYCIGKSAFVDAATLLHRGLELLDPDEKWTRHYDLAFEMTETLAKMELIIGNHDSCRDMTREALLRATTTEMKIKSLLIDVECCMTCNEMDGSIAAANRALEVLGIKMPRKVTFRHVMLKLIKVKWMIGRKSDQDILGLPPMKDQAMATAVRLLLYQCMYCFLQDEDFQAVYSALLATELTLKGGLSPYSASALTIYGLAELSNGNYRRAYRFGKLALTLLDQIENRDAECPTTGLALTLLTHWYDPVREMPDVLLRAVHRGFQVGDVVYATYCLSNWYGMEVMLGLNLEELETFMRATYQTIRDLSHDAMVMWAQAAIQYVLNLRNQEVTDWSELSILTGEVMEEGAYMSQATKANHPLLITVAWSYKAQLACLFGFWSLAESIYKDMLGLGESFHFCYGVMPCSLFGGIASYSLYTENGNRKHLNYARKNRKTLRKAKSRGCPNASAFLTLLDAEELAVRKSVAPGKVSDAYNVAIAAMDAEQLCHIEALANERAGFFQAKVGNRAEAEKHFERAMKLYKYEWGAIAKHDWLKEESVKVLAGLHENVPRVIGDVTVLSEELIYTDECNTFSTYTCNEP